MRRLITGRTAISLFFFLLACLAVYRAFDFSFAARMMPLIIGIPTLVLSAVVLVTEIASQWTGKPRRAEGAMDGSRLGKDLEPLERRAMARREASVILWLIGLVVLIWLFGLLWSIPVFLVLFLRLQGREPWRLIIPVSLGTWAVVYLLFVQILSMELYQGLIQSLWSD
jgi:putative tricarboxylic transport membrane protein